MTTHFPDPTDLLNFTLTIKPDEGLFSSFKLIFSGFLTSGGSYSQFFFFFAFFRGRRSGMYKGGSFVFNFVINLNYPHEPPKVKCTQKVRLFLWEERTN
jgi:ubiquitin-conjugating enzyme E2 M